MTMYNSSKYKVRVSQVMPVSSESQLFDEKRCVLGVSMTNPVFWRSSLHTLVDWMGEHFEESMVLVGDYLHRLNEQVISGCSEEEAGHRAIQMGDDFLEKLQPSLEANRKKNIVVQRWKPFHEDEAFWTAKREMEMLYANNPTVQASINSTATLFVWQKQDRKQFKVDKETAIRLSAQYLLEEMAVFSLLIDRGWKVVLYPGAQLPLLMEIAKGRFKDIPNHLHKGIYVELNVRKKK